MDVNLPELIKKHLGVVAISDIERSITLLERMLGIGSGVEVGTSGERVAVEVLKSMCRETATIFDVGANKGQYCSMLHGLLKDELPFQVHSFEPSKVAFGLLVQNMKGIENVTLNNLGLFSESGERTLYSDKEGSGLASLTARRLNHYRIEHGRLQEKVKLTTLDAYCQERNIQTIDLIKIDVEGHELDVIQGGTELFERGGVKIVQFEFGGCNIDTRTYFQDFYYFFLKKDFDVHRILPGGTLLKIGRYEESLEKFRTSNYLAIRRRE